MAIDTETKRRSVLRPVPCVPVLPLPDSTSLSRADSAHMMIYSGIAITGSILVVDGPIRPIDAIDPIQTI